ncbi:MAG: PilZ domain-containing protein [Proteobacteria bacterium]|nr:PilZ domain-containing protein [Pseudomonadota bacterium]
MTETEKREYFRIEDQLSIKLRIITHDEFMALENTVRFSSAKTAESLKEIQFLKGIVTNEEKEKEQLYTYLQVIDKKLDIILDYLSETTDTGPYITKYLKVYISGSGIGFVSDIEMKEGEYVEIKIVLPIYPHLKITTLCRVLKGETRKKDDKHLWEVALSFLVINDNDRDLLINYIFMKEREMLRHKKESTG